MPAGARHRQDEEEYQEEDKRNPEGVKHPADFTVVKEVLKSVARFFADARRDIIRVSVAVDDITDSAGYKHCTQGGYKRRQFELTHKHTVYTAHGKAAQNGEQDCRIRIDAMRHQRGGNHCAHAYHGTDRQVDVAGDHDKALPDTDQQVL